MYCKVTNSSLFQLVARFQIFRRLMKRKFDAYVLWPLFQNWIVDPSTARDITVISLMETKNGEILPFFCNFLIEYGDLRAAVTGALIATGLFTKTFGKNVLKLVKSRKEPRIWSAWIIFCHGFNQKSQLLCHREHHTIQLIKMTIKVTGQYPSFLDLALKASCQKFKFSFLGKDLLTVLFCLWMHSFYFSHAKNLRPFVQRTYVLNKLIFSFDKEASKS